MTYLALTFPPRIAMNASRQAKWRTQAVRNYGGHVKANQVWDRTIYAFDIGFAVRTASDYEAVVQHFHEARGRANTFPFKDYLDFEVSATEGTATLISGSTYQLYKAFGSTNQFTRKITRPISGTCTFYRTRASVQSVITPTVDYSTGQITVTGHVGGDTYQWAGQFNVPCRYLVDELPGAIISREGAGEHLVQCDSVLIEESLE